MKTKEPFSWLRYVEKALVDLDEIPLLGHVPPFDWEGLSEHLKQFLQIQDLQISPNSWSWQNNEQLQENFCSGNLLINIAVLPLQGHVSLMLPAGDVNSLVSWIVQRSAGSNALVSSLFSEGLVHFLASEVIHTIQPFKSFDGFMLRLLSSQEAPEGRALTMHVSIQAYKEKLSALLIIPEAFRKQWMQHFSQKPKLISSELASSINLDCTLDLARIQMNTQDWTKISPGDFIPLNTTGVDLENNSASLYLSVSQKPIYRVRIKNNGLKILEQPIYQEDLMDMDQNEDDLLSEISELEQEKQKSLDPIPEEEADLNEAPLNEENIEESVKESEEPIAVKHEKNPLEKVEMVPLNIVVEVTRFKMSCDKILHLKPGNLIELNVSLEKPVDLVANGKKIATGELVRIGESLGVQITEMA